MLQNDLLKGVDGTILFHCTKKTDTRIISVWERESDMHQSYLDSAELDPNAKFSENTKKKYRFFQYLVDQELGVVSLIIFSQSESQ